MKILLVSLLFNCVFCSLLQAQALENSLNKDRSFRQALRSVQYPLLAEQPVKPAKVYVDFTVDKDGKIGQVQLLKMGSFSDAFMGEVTRLVAGLPPQKSTYAGEYVLPVVFEAKPKVGVNQSTVLDRAAFDRTFVQLTHSKVLLDELYVVASK